MNVQLDTEKLSDTESNLKPSILRKILFRLGFDPSLADDWSNDVDLLIGRRNNIAHGAERSGVSHKIYHEFKEVVIAVMNAITQAIFQSAANREYARQSR